MATTIIYHQIKPGVDCPDGYAAAWVAHKAYPDASIVGCTYQSDPPSVEPGSHVVIVDFSFPKEVLEQWAAQDIEITLLDHHKTAQEHLEDISGFAKTIKGNIVFDMNECGATLAWQYFFPNQPMPLFLKYVRDRDLWIKEMDNSEAIHTVIGKLGRTFEMFDFLESCKGYDSAELFKILGRLGDVLLSPKRKAVSAAADRAERSTLENTVWTGVPVVILKPDGSEDYLVSEICEELYKNRFPDAAFVACLTSDKTWSLRSDKNKPGGGFDVGALAKERGGGGHHNAAGYKDRSE